ncbi:MAG: hypothetical protein WC438_02635 [Candidatus Pacearchaeota archaeon]
MLKRRLDSKRINLFPGFKPQIEIPKGCTPNEARSIMNQRIDVSKKNTSLFFRTLFQSLYGGEFTNIHGRDSNGYFHPDLVIGQGENKKDIEVKAVSAINAKPLFGHRQFRGYCWNLINQEASEMYSAIFKYGNRKMENRNSVKLYVCSAKNRDEHNCDNRCLAERLSNADKSLLILPHNLLSFILMISEHQDMDHTNSDSFDSETYGKPYGAWLSLLHKNWNNSGEAVDRIFSDKRLKEFKLMGMKPEDFYLNELKTRQFEYPLNACCQGYKIKPFIVTEYENPIHEKWRKKLEDNLESIFLSMGIKDILPPKPRDDIPF